MALRKPAFEGQETTTTATPAAPAAAEAPEVQQVAEPATVAAANEASPSTAVAAPANTSVAVGGKYQPALAQFEKVIDPSTLDFDTFRRVTVDLEGFNDDADVLLGKRIKIQVMSFNERFICSPGKQDAESNELVRYSLDGKTIDETGESCADYIKKLQEVDGYEDAALKKYLNIYGFLVATAETEKADFVEIAPEDRDIVSIQIPPRSFGKFTRFQIEDGVKVSQGILQPTDVVVLTQNKVKGKTTNYAEVTFSRK